MSNWLIKIHVLNNLPYKKFGIISNARVVKYFHLIQMANATISYEKKGYVCHKNSLMIASKMNSKKYVVAIFYKIVSKLLP